MNDIKKFFGVELLNRIDSVLFFTPFSAKTIEKIIMNKIHKKYPEMSKEATKSLMQEIKKDCQYEEFGARKIDKLLEQKDFKYSLE